MICLKLLREVNGHRCRTTSQALCVYGWYVLLKASVAHRYSFEHQNLQCETEGGTYQHHPEQFSGRQLTAGQTNNRSELFGMLCRLLH